MYRHSLFYSVEEEAQQAEEILHLILDADAEIDGVIVDPEYIECRFYTPDRLRDSAQTVVIHQTQPDAYALNCEDY